FKVKLIFGLMMFATSLWLASLMTPFIGKFSTILMSLSIVISVLIWIGRKLGRKVLIPIVATTTLVFGAALIIGSVTADNWATPIVDDLAWQKLDSKQIPQLVEQGKTVFVDVT
ncbi:cytochrome C biogenesis protein, partial [Vibrio sp. 10N.222.49.E5]